MKTRIVSMLLLAVMLMTALPIGVFSLISFAAEAEEMTEKDYDALYYTEGLQYAYDFYRLNEYWSPNGHGYVIPVGPSDDAAYYDATTGKTFDFTAENNRFEYTIVKTAADGTESVLADTYFGEADASARLAELTAAETDGAVYTAVKGSALHKAWARAVDAWVAADKAFLAQFATCTVQGTLLSANNAFGTNTASSRHNFARSAYASLDNGYVTLLAKGETFKGGGGLQLSQASAGLGTAEIVSELGDAAGKAYILFNNLGLTPTKDTATKTYTITGSYDRVPQLGVIKSASPFPYDKVTTLSYTMKDGAFKLYNGNTLVLDATYTGDAAVGNYLGWNNSSCSTKLYAGRYYLGVLDENARAQNHFADMVKFFRIDASAFADGRGTFSAEAINAFYAAFGAVNFDSTRDAVQAVYNAAYAVLCASASPDTPDTPAPSLTEADYNALYVQSGLAVAFDIMALNGYWGKTDSDNAAGIAFPRSPMLDNAYRHTDGKTYDFTKLYVNEDGVTYPYYVDRFDDAARDSSGKLIASPEAGKEKEYHIVTGTRDAQSVTGYKAFTGHTSIIADTNTYYSLDSAYERIVELEAADKKNAYDYFIVGDDTSAAYKAAAAAYAEAVNAWLEEYTWEGKGRITTGTVTGYNKDLRDAFMTYAAVADPISATADPARGGYLIRQYPYCTDKGIQITMNSIGASGATMELVTRIGTQAATNFAIFGNVRPTVSGNEITGTNTNFTAAAGTAPVIGAFDRTAVDTLRITVVNSATENADTLRIAQGDTTLYSAVGTYTDNKTCILGYGNSFKNGEIYNIRIYDRALSPTEEAQNHFADLAKWFRLDIGDFKAYGTPDKERVYTAFAGYTYENVTKDELQAAYDALVLSFMVEKYEAHYLEGEAYAAHNAFVAACIAKMQKAEDYFPIDGIYTIPLSERGAIYALSGDALTEAAIAEAITAYWAFDEAAYKSYNDLYYDEGNLVAAYDFFALNSYWNVDRVAGYLPTFAALAGWESLTADGGRYFDRFAVKGRLTLRHEGSNAPFTLPAGDMRGGGGFVLIGAINAADGFSISGLGDGAASAELVLRADTATDTLFSLSGLSLGVAAGAYTAPSGMHTLTDSEGIGTEATLGTVSTYSLVATNAGRGKAAALSLAVDGTPVLSAVGTAMADPTGTATLAMDNSLTGALYAIRYYRTAISDAERAQNHFADIAKFYRIDLADIDLILTHPAEASALYAAFADLGYSETREEVQGVYDAFRAAFLSENPTLAALRDEASGLLVFEGFQVRIAGTEAPAPNAYAGMRGVFTVDEALLAAMQERGYTVRFDVAMRNAAAGHAYLNNAPTMPIYDGTEYVAKTKMIGEIGRAFVVTVVYATENGNDFVPMSDGRVAELITLDVAYECAVTLEKDGVTYAFTYAVQSDTFGDTVSPAELYRYFGEEGNGLYQGSQKEDTLVKKMLSLIPPEESAVKAPTVGKLMLAADGEAYYTVTLPEGASADVRAAVEAFAGDLSTLSGATFTPVSEGALRLDREILITNGAERADAVEFSAAAVAEGLSYAIGVSGERILVYAEDGAALAEALTVLLASVTDNGTDDGKDDNADGFYLPAVLAIDKSGTGTASIADYTVVVPAGITTARLAKVTEYIDALAARTGITLRVVRDNATVTGRRILVTTAAGKASAAAFLASTSYTGYAIGAAGNDIVVSAYFDVALRAALSSLFATVSDDGIIPTDVSAACDLGAGAGVPLLTTNGTLDLGSLYYANYNSYTASYSGVSATEHLAYCDLLAECGLVLYAENAINGNLFATYTANGAVVSIAFYPSLSEMDITITPEGAMLPSAEAAPYEKDPDITPSVTLMDHSLASYVMQLEDGSFLIVDGGDLNRAGAMDKMWDHLTSLTPAGQKPVISLWMLTHAHSDHALLFVSFLEKYKDDLVLKAVAYNFPDYESLDLKNEAIDMYQGFDGLAVCAAKVEGVLDLYYPDAEWWIPRTGEVHSVAGAEIEILFSHEDKDPRLFTGGNTTSSGWRITLGGSTVVYLGDMTDDSCKRIGELYGAALEADILQVTHHGVSGGDLALYQYIDPKICFWGTAESNFEGDKCNGTGDYEKFTYNKWVRTTDWTRTVNGEEVSGAREHYHGSVRTTILLPVE